MGVGSESEFFDFAISFDFDLCDFLSLDLL